MTIESFINLLNIKQIVSGLILLSLLFLTTAPLLAESGSEHKSLINLAALLQEREKTLKEREASLNEQEKRISLLQKELEKQESEMQNSRDSFAKVLADIKALKDEDLSRLVDVYTAMKPAAAAPLLQKLDLKYAVEVILRMPTKKSAKLLSAVDKEQAVAISRAITEIKPAEK